MEQVKKFFNTTLFQVDGMTFTVGVIVVVVVLVYVFVLKK